MRIRPSVETITTSGQLIRTAAATGVAAGILWLLTVADLFQMVEAVKPKP